MKVDNQLTAVEAKKLSGLTQEGKFEANLSYAFREIRLQCEKVKKNDEMERKVILRCGDAFTHGAYDKTDLWRRLSSYLEGQGYAVSIFYEKRQFVDLGTMITW